MDSSSPNHQTLTEPLTASQSVTLTSLQDLALRGSWRTLLDIVNRSRQLPLDPHLHLTYTAFSVLSLTKLRRFDEASSYLQSLQDLDSPSYLYETYPETYPSQSGSMVPFFLRWIRSVIPHYLGQTQETLDRLYTLLDFVRLKSLEKESSGLLLSSASWRRREAFVTNSIVSHHLVAREYCVCFRLIMGLIRNGYEDPLLISKLGYVQMQAGDLEGAKLLFHKIESMQGGEGLTGDEFRSLVNRNRALVYLAGKDYASAVREYEKCVERDDSDVVAINNKAICLMYLRDLSDSIKVLEAALERVPTAALNETLVVNLCSMYELAYVNHSDNKRTLSSWISRVAPDDFDSSCTRT